MEEKVLFGKTIVPNGYAPDSADYRRRHLLY